MTNPLRNLHGLLAAGLTGLMIEVGDGFSRYQFCPQDLIRTHWASLWPIFWMNTQNLMS